MTSSADPTPELTVCEIAFVADGQRYHAQIPLPKESIEILSNQVEAVEEELRQFSGQVIKGFSFLWSVGDVIDSSAMELYETLYGEVGYQDDEEEDEEDEYRVDWKGFKAAAQALDAQVSLSQAGREPVLVEFVWDNGGDDDNLFGQGFVGLSGSPHLAEVKRHLESLEEAGQVYDLSFSDPRRPSIGENQIQDLIDWSNAHPQMPVLANFLKQAKSFDASVVLEDQLPAVDVPRRGPRF